MLLYESAEEIGRFLHSKYRLSKQILLGNEKVLLITLEV